MGPIDTGKTVSGVCASATSVNYTINGTELNTVTGVATPKELAQGQLPSSVGTLYTAPANTSTFVKRIILTNTTAGALSITLYENGTATANQTISVSIPASGELIASDVGYQLYDSGGNLLTSSSITLTGDVTGAGASPVATTLATVNSNVGSFGTSSQVAAFTVNAKGLTTAASNTAIRDASTSQSGFESAAQFNTVNNLWYDVTNYGVSISNSGAANTSAMNTLIQTTAGNGATFYFPQTGANYPFNGAIVVTKNGQKFRGTGDFNSVLFDGSTTDDLFRVQDAVNKPEFYDLGMWVTVVKVSGAAINFGTVSSTGNPQANIYRCGFNTFGGTWFDGIVYNGSRGGEVSKCEDVVMNGFTRYGIALIGNTSTPATTSALYLDNVLMNGSTGASTGATAGVFTQQAGAVQFSNCDVISCTNNYLAAPITSSAQVVASVYCINTYFDHSNGSCVKFGGTQPIVRCKFVACSMTVNTGGNYSAIEFANTAANPPADIDIQNCNIQNTFNNVGTSNGILAVGVGNCMIQNNNINGFTNNIQVTPATPAGSARLIIMGNNIGPGTVAATTSTVDILLNAGATTYGLVKIQDNNFNITNAFQTGSTTAITDNSTIIAGGAKLITGNTGRIASAAPSEFPATLIPLTTPVTRAGSGWGFPVNSLRIGARLRITVGLTCAATAQTLTPTLKMGTANTNADGDLWTSAAFVSAGTAALGSMTCQYDISILSATTVMATGAFINGAAGITGVTQQPLTGRGSAGPITVASVVTTAFFIAPYFVSATASAVTVRSVAYEVIQQ